MDKIHIQDFKGKHIHFIGIGGSSMSGLADILQKQGYSISGSDMKASAITDRLQKQGIQFFEGHDAKNIKGSELIVHTAAIQKDNIEIQQAKALLIPIIDRATLLGQIMEDYPHAVGVSGTHGKTTTTSMIATVLELGGLDPTIHIGGELDLIGGSTKAGKSPYFITEACEYVESFLKLHPTLAVVLNIDEDHLDYFRDLEHIYQSFLKYVALVPHTGTCIGCGDDSMVARLFSEVSCNAISYGINKNNDYLAFDILFNESAYPSFSVTYQGKYIGRFQLSVPGQHNIYNALATIATARFFDLSVDMIQNSLRHFTGAHRRFELQGTIDGIKIIHDYAHHPTEIKATLRAAAMLPHKRLWCIFQPHTYSRTQKLFREFTAAFEDADRLIITDIYAAREQNHGNIHARDLVAAISANGQECIYKETFNEICKTLFSHWQAGDIVLTLGAGSIEQVGKMLLEGNR